jgi:DNA polymerase-3 subunit alpha
MKFCHLHLHSHYSLLDGLSKIDEIVSAVKEFGMDAVALTDHGNLYGAIEFYQKAKKEGIKPIIGAELYVAPRTRFDREPNRDSEYFHLPVLCENEIGYKNLLQLITKSHLEGFYYKPRVDKELLMEFHQGLIVLSGCLRGEIPRAILAGQFERAKALIAEHVDIFGKQNFYLELQHHPEFPEQKKVNNALKEFSKEFGLEIVVTADAHYPKKEDKAAHDILLAVQTGTKVDDAERMTMKDADFHIKSTEEIAEDFSDIPEALENTCKIAARCNLIIDLDKVILPEFALEHGETAIQRLRNLVNQKFANFYDSENQEAKTRLNYELDIIEKTGFADYFLIVQDFIEFAKSRAIPTNTRGSAAGSLVSYVLGITTLDPIRYGLYFERFLNPERIALPDIDLDVADSRRSEIIEYIREKYGKDQVAQIITFGVMKARLAVRDVARALGMPYVLGDQISKLIPWNVSIDQALETSQELRNLVQTNPDASSVIETARRLEGVVRHASTHAAGVVISKEPLVNYTPLQHSSRSSSEIITQYSMYDIEKIGLLKMDVLGLANLTTIKNALRIIKKVQGEDIDIDRVSLDDPKAYELLARGDTVGVFQLESSGMTHFLKELKPSRIEDIIVMVSLYRPGPLDAKMIPEYISRKHGKKKIEYLDPRMVPILKETYGIIVYQEQLMKIAQVIAGFTMSEADTLRKAVGKKIKKLLDEQREKFVAGAIKHGLAPNKASQLWEFVEPFARYGFNRAHAASYARIAYQTAWLKARYPAPFMAALLTSDYGNLDRIAIEVAECGRMGIKIIPPSVNKSFVEFGVVPETGEIVFSLAAIKGIGDRAAEIIQEERKKNGLFVSLADFVERMPKSLINKKTLECLIKSGSFDEFGERRQMLEGISEILRYAEYVSRAKNSSQASLFGGPSTSSGLGGPSTGSGLGGPSTGSGLSNPSSGGVGLRLPKTEPATRQERLQWEKELLGFYLSDHPLAEYVSILEKLGTPIEKLKELVTGKRATIGGMIASSKRIITKTGKPMLFSQLQDSRSKVEVVVFPDIFAQNPLLWQEDNVVLVRGRVDSKNGSLKFICEQAEEIRNFES